MIKNGASKMPKTDQRFYIMTYLFDKVAITKCKRSISFRYGTLKSFEFLKTRSKLPKIAKKCEFFLTQIELWCSQQVDIFDLSNLKFFHETLKRKFICLTHAN